jgi:hypothetical protein
MTEERRGRLPLPPPPNPLEAIERFDTLVRELDETVKRLDSAIGRLTVEPSRIVPPPMRIKPEFAREVFRDLDEIDRTVGRGLELLRDGKLSEAAELLTKASGEASKKCQLCSDALRKGALEIALAATSRNLGEREWREHLARAEETLRRIRGEVIPRIRRSIEASL